VSRAEQLNIVRCERRATFANWQHVVKMQFVGCTAENAPSPIVLPHVKFYLRADQASTYGLMRTWPIGRLGVTINCDQFELKDTTPAIVFRSSVDEVEQSVIGPNPCLIFRKP
jgi:hypothetical protein